jgi:hypothetical protein
MCFKIFKAKAELFHLIEKFWNKTKTFWFVSEFFKTKAELFHLIEKFWNKTKTFWFVPEFLKTVFLTGSLTTSTGTFLASALVPDGRIQGRWTQKWPSKISCGLGSQRPRKRPNSKFPNCGLILTIIGKNSPKTWKQQFFTALFQVIWGVAGLRPNFFSSGRIFLAELAQESWRDLAAVGLSNNLTAVRKYLWIPYYKPIECL